MFHSAPYRLTCRPSCSSSSHVVGRDRGVFPARQYRAVFRGARNERLPQRLRIPVCLGSRKHLVHARLHQREQRLRQRLDGRFLHDTGESVAKAVEDGGLDWSRDAQMLHIYRWDSTRRAAPPAPLCANRLPGVASPQLSAPQQLQHDADMCTLGPGVWTAASCAHAHPAAQPCWHAGSETKRWLPGTVKPQTPPRRQ